VPPSVCPNAVYLCSPKAALIYAGFSTNPANPKAGSLLKNQTEHPEFCTFELHSFLTWILYLNPTEKDEPK
jgi:hypothetical protein